MTCSDLIVVPFATAPPSTNNPYHQRGGSDCYAWCMRNNEQQTGVLTNESVLNQHNGYRNESYNTLLNTNQRISKPRDISWSQEAFCSARCSAKRCTNLGSHQAHDTTDTFAENLAWTTYGIQQFHSEIQHVLNGVTRWGVPGKEIGHWDNMINNNYVGCSLTQCGQGVGDMRSGVELRCKYHGRN